ncbi:hypothetical protein QVD17_32447 [Tagetes erecta]|uniref:RNA-dependent RNA polymerase n=1 Tax=Tagetes erecta TaxID=13708 RepID=A0AAD8JZX1_TARER|nr:hypothetical protein QVD17_32447 [Tagetes erecta]
MGSDRVTQVSVGGFGNGVTAKMVLEYLEKACGQIWRCRLKKSSTPPDTYPQFDANLQYHIQSVDYENLVEPHAYVQFVHPHSVDMLLEAAGNHKLMLNNNLLKLSLGPPSRRTKTQLQGFKLSDVVLQIGVLSSRDKFIVGWRGPKTGLHFIIDPFDCICKFLFTKQTAFYIKGTKNHVLIKCNYKVEFLVRDIVNDVREYADYSVLVFQLASSPCISYRTADDDIINTFPFEEILLLDDDDPWIRTTDFTPSGAIGRCNTYHMTIRTRDVPKMKRALQFLQDQRLHIEHRKTTSTLKLETEPEFGLPIPDPFFSIHYKQGISFKVLFLVNSVLHRGIINQHQFTEQVFDLLRSQPEEVNLAALNHICSYRHPLYDGFTRLKLVQEWYQMQVVTGDKRLEQSDDDDVIQVGRLIITPSKAYCLPPEVELSNRVLRHYQKVSDRFLRVTFMDEGMTTLNNNVLHFYPAPIVKDMTSSSVQKTSMFQRVKRILTNGFHLSGRQYCFLAFSANQLRDRSAWFFAEDGKISCKDIVSWMGKFSNKNVAKCAARMGQCFSSTYATVDVPRHEVDMNLKDVERNGYVFSDGIGKISPDLALEVAEKLQLKDNQPCAYQIRYAGCKGVVACWPNVKKLCLRPSMNKFESEHTVLEICSWTQFQPGFLNRQIITLLSALNVRDEIFWDMQMKMLKRLDLMLESREVAFDVIRGSCCVNTASIMLASGFDPKTEPHLRGMLSSIRMSQVQDLREKSRIFVSDGRWLMGCFDEVGVLEQGQCFIQVSQGGSKERSLSVIEGDVVIAKNPCLHPGDVRVLKAVNVAAGLDHLFDCLIFPQKGDRPHTDEASGSDLDGDLYFVTWDQNLIPPTKQSWKPMEYTAAEPKLLPRDVRHSDIIDFFTKNMVNESLGTICNAHVVHADMSDYGALDEKCIKLAELAAIAVDFPKTGRIVNMPPHLKPKLYPDFMGKEDFQSYNSEKILGRLYRQVKEYYYYNTSASPVEFSNLAYDMDLEVVGSASFLDDAWGCKLSYDRQLKALLGQFKVRREEEIVTGHIWSMPKQSSKKQGEVKERMKHAYSALRKEFRRVFEHLSGGEFEEAAAAYEKKASAWYQVTYHPIWVNKYCLEAGEMLNLSFAWIAADYLATIKIKSSASASASASASVSRF